MQAHQHAGAAAPRGVTPAQRDEAPTGANGRGFGQQAQADDRDPTAAATGTPAGNVAELARHLNIDARPLGGGAWQLRSTQGRLIGAVRDEAALQRAVAAFGTAQADIAELVRRMREGAR